MECPQESKVAGFAADGLRATMVEEHIDQCDSCRSLLAALVRSEATDAWDPGQRVGRYVLVEAIGRGGMGAVWRADDVELERAVALKRLHAGSREHLFREARTLAQLQHPNVVAVFEVVDDAQAPFLAMELVDGVTLREWLKAPRTWQDIVAMLVQAGRGLVAAHARGLVHRDFKPDNVLVDRSEPRARVADFGLASNDEAALGPALATMETTSCERARFTHTVAGTPAYMAPELIEGDAPNVRTDVYAFAVTAFEALRGQHPFAGDNIKSLWLEMAAGHVRDGGKRIPAWLDRVVRKGLSVDPEARWPDMASFVKALETRPRNTAKVVVVASLAAASAITATAAWSFAPGGGDDCAAGSEQVSDVWNPVTRAGVITRLGAASIDGTPATSTVKIIDHWAQTWRAGRKAACTVGEQRPARIACLDRELGELRSMLSTWSAGIGLDNAVPAAAALAPPNACNSAADSPLVAQHIVMRIAQATTLWRAGRAAEAMPAIPALLHDAELVGHYDTLAQALLVSSYIEHENGDDEAASLHAKRASAEASKSGDHALLYAALIQQAYQRIDEGAPADALGLCDAADALAARGVPHPEKRHMARGGALMRLGRTPDAIAEYDKAIALLDPNRGDPTAQIALGIAFAGRGNAYLLSREPEKAVADQQKALELQLASYGPRHPEVGRTFYDIAQSFQDLNRLEQTSEYLDRARAIFVGAYGEQHPEVGQVDVSRATNAKRRGMFEQARVMFEQARAELEPALRPDHPLFSVIENQLGFIDRKSGRCKEAIPHFEKAYKILGANNIGGEQLAKTDIDLARCLFETGDSVDAKTHAEKALDELSRAGIGEHDRAISWAVLALIADQRGERAKAIQYAQRVMSSTTDADTADSGEAGEARASMRDKLAVWTR